MKKIFLIIFSLIICFIAINIFALEKIEINTASLEQLDTIISIGPVTAQKIIDARPFSSIDDLLRVNGIGEKTLQKIKDQGLVYINGQTSQPADKIGNLITEEIKSAPIPEIIYPTGILINEFLPNPKGPDETDEWIEFYNSNEFDADLSGWQIKDTSGNIKIFTITNTIITSYGFIVLKRTETNIMLNNENDGLVLYSPDGKIVDNISYIKAPLNQSYNIIDGKWSWAATLTPGFKNIENKTIIDNSIKGLSKIKNSVKNDGVELGLANLSQSINTNQENINEPSVKNPWFLFLSVLATTIILAILVLIIKLKFLKNHVRT